MVVAQNLANDTNINVMLPGKRISDCVFGFCDVRAFTTITEALQGGCMMFINEVAKHVHDAVLLNCGFPNKNIGDAFFIVWKMEGVEAGGITCIGARTFLPPLPFLRVCVVYEDSRHNS